MSAKEQPNYSLLNSSFPVVLISLLITAFLFDDGFRSEKHKTRKERNK
jgi:hypothetical protein